MAKGNIKLEVKVNTSLLRLKLEEVEQELYSSRITTDLYIKLIQSVYIRTTVQQKSGSLMLYVDMIPLSDIEQQH